jgi:hypothetical protein
MRLTTIFTVMFFLVFSSSVLCQPTGASGPGGAVSMKSYNVESFVKQVDTNNDGSMSKDEWKRAGLIETPFSFCDIDKNEILSGKELQECKLPEAMDINPDGVLTVNEMIEFDKKMAAAPKKQYVPMDPYVEGGETGIDFIRLFDEDGDEKVTHMEWEKKKNSTVFKDRHWPDYNKNMDEYITVEEAPKKP